MNLSPLFCNSVSNNNNFPNRKPHFRLKLSDFYPFLRVNQLLEKPALQIVEEQIIVEMCDHQKYYCFSFSICSSFYSWLLWWPGHSCEWLGWFHCPNMEDVNRAVLTNQIWTYRLGDKGEIWSFKYNAGFSRHSDDWKKFLSSLHGSAGYLEKVIF